MVKNPNELPWVLTPSEFARLMRVDKRKALSIMKRLPHRKEGRLLRITKGVALAYLEGKLEPAKEGV